MITADGAGVIATIIPIGLLILGFEIHRAPAIVATNRAGTVLLWVMGAILLIGLTFGFWAEWRLVRAAASSEPVEMPEAALIWIALWFVGSGSFLLLLGSLAHRLGLIELIGRRAVEATARSPRRLARKLKYIRKHHPNQVRRDR